jgi:polyisoprenoid-binding protein YceI
VITYKEQAMRWNIDPTHTSIEFSVKHLGIATVRGRFRKFDAVAEAGPDGQLKRVEATIEAASVDTGVDQRDDHLRSADFFDVAKFPQIRFLSTRIEPKGAGESLITGDLTLRGVTRPVNFTLEQGGAIKDPWGNQRVASTATGKLSRKEWGLIWNQLLELGGVAVSDEVKFTFEVQVVAAQAVAA